MGVIKETLSLMFWVLLLRAILSWVSQGQSPIDYVLHQLTEPFLAPIRKVIPPLGGLDLSVLIAIIGLQFLQLLIQDALRVL
jgi:YggT family protein